LSQPKAANATGATALIQKKAKSAPVRRVVSRRFVGVIGNEE